MSVRFLINNPHLAPFIIAFFLGAFCLAAAPLHYMFKNNKTIKIITPFDLTKYNLSESKLLFIGIILTLVGILGAGIMTENYGYTP